MKRRKLIVLGMAFLCLLASVAVASDFSGSWVRDDAKSDPVPAMLMLNRPPATQGRGGAGGGPGGRGNAAEVLMTVQQGANALQVTDPQGAISKYTLDGKPFSRPTETGITKANITVSFQGDTLVILTTQPYGGMPGNNTLEVKEEWSLSPDGRVLTITTTRTIPALTKTFKQVFNRK